MKKFWELFKSKKQVEIEHLKKVLLGFGFLDLIQAGLVLFFGKASYQGVATNYLAYDALLSHGDKIVHTPGTSLLFDINLAWLLSGLLVASAIIYILLATLLNQKYRESLTNNCKLSRWLLFGLSSNFSMFILFILSGVTDISTLILLITIGFLVPLLGYSSEFFKDKAQKFWLGRFVAIKLFAIMWFVVLLYFMGTFIYGGNSINAFIYFAYLIVFLAQMAFIYILKQQGNKKDKLADFIYSEKAVLILSFVLQTAITWQVFFGALR